MSLDTGKLSINAVLEEKTGNCKDQQKCIELFQLIIDEQATDDQIDHFHSHLPDCIKCLENYHLYTEIKSMLRSNVERLTVPTGLEMMIKSKLKEQV